MFLEGEQPLSRRSHGDMEESFGMLSCSPGGIDFLQVGQLCPLAIDCACARANWQEKESWGSNKDALSGLLRVSVVKRLLRPWLCAQTLAEDYGIGDIAQRN